MVSEKLTASVSWKRDTTVQCFLAKTAISLSCAFPFSRKEQRFVMVSVRKTLTNLCEKQYLEALCWSRMEDLFVDGQNLSHENTLSCKNTLLAEC